MSLCRRLEAKQMKQTFIVISIRSFSPENNSNSNSNNKITVNLWLIFMTNIDKIVQNQRYHVFCG